MRLSWSQTPADSRASEPLPVAAPPGGLCAEVDAEGTVLRLSGTLAGELPSPPLSLQQLFGRRNAQTIEEALDSCAVTWDMTLELPRDRLNVRCWMALGPNTNLLYALPIQDLADSLSYHQRHSQRLSLASQLAEELHSCTWDALVGTCEQSLHRLSIECGFHQCAIALRQADRWQIYAQYSSKPPIRWPAGSYLGDLLNKAPSNRVLHLPAANEQQLWQSYFGDGAALLVPCKDQDHCRAWLLIEGSNLELNPHDLQNIAALLVGIVVSRFNEHESRAQQQQHQLLQKLLGANWWSLHEYTQTLEISAHMAELLGCATQMELNEWLSYLHPIDRDELLARLSHLPDTTLSFSQNLRLKINGQLRWYSLQAEWSGSNGARCLNGHLTDIEHTMQQQALAEAAHARLANLVARAPAVIYLQRYDEGRLHLSFCSESLKPLLGYEVSQLQHQGLSEKIHPDDLEVFLKRNKQLLREGSISCRYRLRDRSGHYHWLLDEAKLLRNDIGQPTEVVGIWLDVTQATESAETIRKSEERYRILVEDSPAMICRMQPDTRLIFANRPLLNSLNCQIEQLGHVYLTQWLSPEQQQAFSQRLARLCPDNPMQQSEICVQLPGKQHAWWVWAERGVFNEQGQLLEVHAVGRDNTEVRISQQQLTQSAKMATLGEMATGIAHEMNQPLHVMRMAISNILRRLEQNALEPSYLQEKLQRIESQVQRAARIVDHMRIFGRRSAIEASLFDPLSAIEESAAMLHDSLQSKGIALQLPCHSGEDLQVNGHADQLEQVLINLMVNARDALMEQKEKNPELKPCISIHLFRQQQRVVIEIQDNGGGIDPLLHERIFDPFFTTKEVGHGTGLGLSVSYNIISQMNGKLAVTNRDQGACFSIELPWAALDSPEPAA